MCNSCISVFLAQVLGVLFFLVSLAMLLHQQRFKKIMSDFLSDAPLVNFTGALSILFGMLILACHNVWVADWPVLITLIGWFVLLQGALRVFFPDSFAKMTKDMLTKQTYLIWSWIWLLIGLYLIWVGFSTNG